VTVLWIVPLLVALGFASGWLSRSGFRNAWFRDLRKPWFMPPAWAFPVVWTTLYVLMGVAAARVIDRPGPAQPAALALFAGQFALNLLWSPLFFVGHRVRGALALIVVLDGAVVATAAAFAMVDAAAAWLLAPYLFWLALATALNAAILRLNPSGDATTSRRRARSG